MPFSSYQHQQGPIKFGILSTNSFRFAAVFIDFYLSQTLGSSGKALMILLPTEVQFLNYLKLNKVTLNEYTFPANKIVNVQAKLESVVEKNYYLHNSARMAYKSYISSYMSHQLRDCYNVHDLDLLKVAKSFGFTVPPKIELNIDRVSARSRKTAGGKGGKGGKFGSSGHSFRYVKYESVEVVDQE